MALQEGRPAPAGDGEFPCRARFDGAELLIRVTDFPAEPLYTLPVDGLFQPLAADRWG